MKFRRSLVRLSSLAALVLAASAARAVTVSATGTTAGGEPVSATLDFAVSGNVATLTLTNTTLSIHDASQLLTGVDLTFASGTTLSLTGASGTGRTVAASGAFTDSGTVNLLTAGSGGGPTWSVSGSGTAFRLDFAPDAQYAIIGPPTGSVYASTNSSIAGNGGHNPFVANTATFTLSTSGITTSSLTGVTFLFGTQLETQITGTVPGGGTPPGLPEPASLALLPLALGALALRRARAAG